VFHDSSKQIEIKYYFICDKFEKGEVILHSISIDEKTIDILMNSLSKINIAYLRDKLRFMDISPLVEMEEMN